MSMDQLLFAIGETKNYQQALAIVEEQFPGKTDQWVIETTDKILEMMMETA